MLDQPHCYIRIYTRRHAEFKSLRPKKIVKSFDSQFGEQSKIKSQKRIEIKCSACFQAVILCRLVCARDLQFLLFLRSYSSFFWLCFTWVFSFNKSTPLNHVYMLPVITPSTKLGSFPCKNFATFCSIQCQSWTHKFQKACAFYFIYFNVTYTFLHVTIS